LFLLARVHSEIGAQSSAGLLACAHHLLFHRLPQQESPQ
jgi:hypothetical protein